MSQSVRFGGSIISNQHPVSPLKTSTPKDLLAAFKSQIQDQLHSHRSKLEHLLAKVDSMDNCYDKRLANLEAVVTPLVSNMQPMLAREVENIFNERVLPLVEERLKLVEDIEGRI